MFKKAAVLVVSCGAFLAGLAIENYNQLSLTFGLVRGPATGCQANISISSTVTTGPGGFTSFPSGGLCRSQITIGSGTASYGLDTTEHVITHEMGHCVGLRHSDWYNRAISCGSGGNEGASPWGAIHIPGTPTTAVVGGSIMNTCFRASETGEFTSSDITALTTRY
jgi:hypothetical protein